MIDHYTVLEINQTATAEEIKSAYRRLARKYHPDVNPNQEAEERFKDITKAYEVLGDPEQKQQYDLYGEGQNPVTMEAEPSFSSHYFEEIYRNFSQKVYRSPSAQASNTQPISIPGTPIRIRLRVPFKESILGGKREITFNCDRSCSQCQGTGIKQNTNPQECKTCKGRGEIIRQRTTPFGTFSHPQPCPQCQGAKWEPAEKCEACSGTSVIPTKQTLEIEIPAGVIHETEIKVNGQGHAGKFGGSPGDLSIITLVEDHPEFNRNGIHLQVKIRVPYAHALLGGTIEIKTLDGPLQIKLDPCTPHNKIIQIAGKGIPDMANPQQKGDLFIKVFIEFPKTLSTQEKELLEQIAKLTHHQSNPQPSLNTRL